MVSRSTHRDAEVSVKMDETAVRSSCSRLRNAENLRKLGIRQRHVLKTGKPQANTLPTAFDNGYTLERFSKYNTDISGGKNDINDIKDETKLPKPGGENK